jgi:hypothetical protein
MTLKQLTQEHFIHLIGFLSPRMPGFHREVEWWASVNENVVGAVILDLVDKDWSWVILGRDQVGRFRAFDLGVSLRSQEESRSRLLDALLTNADTKVFPQDAPI